MLSNISYMNATTTDVLLESAPAAMAVLMQEDHLVPRQTHINVSTNIIYTNVLAPFWCPVEV